MLLELSESLKTGIASIDEQHASLVDLHNDIIREFGTERPVFHTLEALARLYQYCRQHFDSEEQLMLRYAYAGYEAHHAEHQILLVELRKTVLRYRSDVASVDDSIKDFVRDWVLKHIEESDLAFAEPILEAMERERNALTAV